ncbi:hypothetical protein [Escherichia coli]|uniref:hypothetical protein n=1 Tax=Escherichia coli TaxID=562 RepID=UPI001593A0D7|nr:hypothetical protein [Escherichia coli]
MNDPVTIARELLQIDISAIGGSIIVDGVDVLETTRAAQKVARAVIRVEELADRLDDGHLRHLIRTTLNGDTHA